MPAREPNFTFLLIALLAVLLAAPVAYELFSGFTTRGASSVIISLAFSCTLLIGIWSLQESRTWFVIGVVLAIMSAAITVTEYVLPSKAWHLADLCVALAFCLMSLIFAFRHIATGDRMDTNRIVGAICVYLLLGFTLAIGNIFIYQLVPDAFSGITGTENSKNGLDLIYFTFVTMTTLGYGDIEPIRPVARAVAYLTAIVGQFYIAVLVGTIVGLYIRDRDND
jgi:voltage-gated potassium channel